MSLGNLGIASGTTSGTPAEKCLIHQATDTLGNIRQFVENVKDRVDLEVASATLTGSKSPIVDDSQKPCD